MRGGKRETRDQRTEDRDQRTETGERIMDNGINHEGTKDTKNSG